MSADWPAEIAVTETPSGVVYCLPERGRYVFRIAGRILLCAGLFILIVPIIGTLVHFQQGFDLAKLLVHVAYAAPIPIVFFVVRSYVVGACDITLENGTLKVTDRGLLFPLVRRRPFDQISRISLRFGRQEPQLVTHPREEPTATKTDENSCSIEVSVTKGQSMTMAFGYPARLLWPLAIDLNRRLSMPAAPSLNNDGTVAAAPERPPLPPVEVVCGKTPVFVDRPDQPAKSNVILERKADGLTLAVPPAGIVNGSKGLFAFAVLWNGFLALLLCLSLPGLFLGKLGPGALPGGIVFVIFCLVGISMALAAYHMGKRSAVLAVIGETLMILQTGPFGEKRGEWDRDELADIRPGPSGMEVNKRPVMELHVQPIDGKCFGILGGRDIEELEWIATLLRQALRVPATTPAEDRREDLVNS
jgi:hypothetical protein